MTLPLARLLSLEPRQLTSAELYATAYARSARGFGDHHVERRVDRDVLVRGGTVIAWAWIGGAA
jgi:hypothetical protein